jgi:hypothetical protein
MLEHFPVGKRLAFDQANGRLWVVCGVCRQWNLSPFDERWEAIEEGERLFRDTRLRVSTDQIGLARMKDGTELIRIGAPQRPEFAAWRYGERFQARWAVRGRLAAAAGGLVALQKGIGGFLLWQFATGPFIALGIASATAESIHLRRRVARLQLPTGESAALTQAHVESLRIVADPDEPTGWQLRVRHRPLKGLRTKFSVHDPEITFRGEEARRVASRLLPRLNRSGGRRQVVAEAVEILDQAGSADAVFRLASRHDPDSGRMSYRERLSFEDEIEQGAMPPTLARLRTPLKLATEMAAHEEMERAALAGELADLHERWKEAEEIAAIADTLTLSPAVLERLDRLRLRL